MSPDLARELALCGALLAGLTGLANHVQSDFPPHVLLVGLIGGLLCVLWATLGRRGRRARVGAVLTLSAVACCLGVQVVQASLVSWHGPPRARIATVLLTVLIAFSLGTCRGLMNDRMRPRS